VVIAFVADLILVGVLEVLKTMLDGSYLVKAHPLEIREALSHLASCSVKHLFYSSMMSLAVGYIAP
jgi:hypothetical protein